MTNVPPVLLALQLCDAIHIDPETRKRTVFGQFRIRVVDSFPHFLRTISVHIALIDCPPRFSTRIDIVDSVLEESILDEPIEGTSFVDDTLNEFELDIRIRNLSIPRPGYYLLRLIVDGAMVGQRKLNFAERNDA